MDLTTEMEHIEDRPKEAIRELLGARSARERALRARMDEAEGRVRALEHRVTGLLLQRAEMEAELEVTRSAMKRVEETLNTLRALERRKRAAVGRRTCRGRVPRRAH